MPPAAVAVSVFWDIHLYGLYMCMLLRCLLRSRWNLHRDDSCRLPRPSPAVARQGNDMQSQSLRVLNGRRLLRWKLEVHIQRDDIRAVRNSCRLFGSVFCDMHPVSVYLLL